MSNINDTEWGRNYAKKWRKEVFGQCTAPTDFFNQVIDQYSPVVWGTVTCARDIERQYADYLIELQKSMQTQPVVNPPANGIYQLDLAALRGFRPEVIDRFPTPNVLIDDPYWHPDIDYMVVRARSVDTNAEVFIPCDWLTPNPAPHFRFLTTVNGHVTGDITVQGIPVEYAEYAPIILKDGFEWVGVNLGSQRVSIERVIPPVGEGVPE